MSEAAGPGWASILRTFSQWLLGAILAVFLAAFFLVVGAAQLTSGETGQRLLRRAVAVTTEIDAALPGIHEQLQQAARESDADPVRVPEFPIPVDLPRQEAFTVQREELRGRILDAAAHRLYKDGMSAWAAADPEADQQIETISTAGVLHRGLGLITEESHRRFIVAAAVLGALSLALALMLLASVRGWARLIAPAAAVLGAALPSLAAAIAVRFGFRAAQEEADPFVAGLLRLGVDAMWVPIRGYLALSSLGLAVIAAAALLLWWRSRGAPRPGTLPDTAP